MRIVGIQSVPLSRDTRNAWRDNGVLLLRRSRPLHEVYRILDRRRPYDVIINLGNSEFDYPGVVYNQRDVVAPLLTPVATREVLGDYLPPVPTCFPADVWVKGAGRAGLHKQRILIDRGYLDVVPDMYDVQLHMEGQEFRLVTVDHKVVQCAKRYGENNNRRYEWTPMGDVSMELKDMVREASRRLGDRTIIAWDTIVGDDGVFVFEGNASPGLNTHTARRIVAQIERSHNAAGNLG